jgi:two-component system sensor histidine kinase/response regulator
MNPPPPEVPAAAKDTTVPARILVVDDQSANIQVVGGVLGKLGHEIIPASDGPTALRRLALRPPDLILLDLLMPEMDGCEVCRRLRANPEWRDIPVIFLSAADDKDFIVRALESGGVDYITKPFNQAELVSRVRTQLALKSARDRLKQLAEDKDELLGILAHDLKNHLGGMQMSAQLLRDRVARPDNVDARAALLAENIAHSSGQLLSFVKEFLANAAADHGITIKPATSEPLGCRGRRHPAVSGSGAPEAVGSSSHPARWRNRRARGCLRARPGARQPAVQRAEIFAVRETYLRHRDGRPDTR